MYKGSPQLRPPLLLSILLLLKPLLIPVLHHPILNHFNSRRYYQLCILHLILSCHHSCHTSSQHLILLLHLPLLNHTSFLLLLLPGPRTRLLLLQFLYQLYH